MMSTTASSSTPDTLTNLLTLLPTGTYLVFSTIVSITTNNGNCDLTEKIVTGFCVFIFSFLCAFFTFTDSYAAGDDTMWYGVVTTKGLWIPFFANSPLPNVSGWTYVEGGTKYILKFSDFYVGFLSVISFLTLAVLSSALTDCYYKGINGNVMKAVPLAVNFFVGIAFSFAPSSRHSVGFAFTKSSKSASASSSTGATSARSPSVTADLLTSQESFQSCDQKLQRSLPGLQFLDLKP